MNSILKQARQYRKREITQVRQAVTTACVEMGYKPNIRIAALDDDMDCLLITLNVADDVLLRNAVTEALSGYDLTWCEEYTALSELSFIMGLGYWRIRLSLDEMKKARPRHSLVRWLRSFFSPSMVKEPEPELEAMDEGDD